MMTKALSKEKFIVRQDVTGMGGALLRGKLLWIPLMLARDARIFFFIVVGHSQALTLVSDENRCIYV